MKKKISLCILLCFVLFYHSKAQEYCSAQSTFHYYEGARLNAMRSFFVDDSMGYLVASDVSSRPAINTPDTIVILKTTNKGKDWYSVGMIKARLVNPAYEIRFTDSLNGFITIRYTLTGGLTLANYRTKDGGKNWERFNNSIKFQIQDYSQKMAIFSKSDSLYVLTDELLSIKIPHIRSLKVAKVLNDSTVFTLCETLSGMSVQSFKIRENTLVLNDSISVINTNKTNYGLGFLNESTSFFWNGNTLYRKKGNTLTSFIPPVKIENINLVHDTLILSSGSELYYSTDEGESWASHPYSSMSVSYSTYRDIHFLDFSNVFMHSPAKTLWIQSFSHEAITILEEPKDQTIRENCPAVFRAKGEGNLKYQWYFKQTILPNETKDSLVISQTSSSHSGEYYCEIRNACNGQKTRPAVLKISSAVTIKTQPQSFIGCLGDTVQLSVSADSVSYQWYQNGMLLPKTNDSSLQFVLDQTNVGMTYSCLLSDLICGKSIFSDTIRLNKKADVGHIPQPLLPKMLVCSQTSLNLNIGNVEGAISYTWYKNGIDIGVSVPNLSFSSISEKDTAVYACRVKGNCSYRESSTHLVLAPPLKILSYSDTILHCANEDKIDTFFVEAENAVSYQWSKAENPEDGKKSQMSMLIHAKNLPNMYCTVKGYCEQLQTLSVYFALPPKITPLKVPTICTSDTASPVFISTNGSANIIHFQWYMNDVLLKRDTTSGIWIPKHAPSDIFTCEAYSLLCPSVSTSASIAYYKTPNITKYPLDTIFFACKGEFNIRNGCYLGEEICYRSSYDTNGFLSVVRTGSEEHGACFFDRHKVKLMPKIDLNTPFNQYVSDFDSILHISSSNADLYIKEGYSYRWLYSLNNGENWLVVPNSENKNSILPLKNKGNSLYKIETDFPMQCENDIVQACWMEEYPKADSGWFLLNVFPLPLLSISFIDEKIGSIGCAEKSGLLTTIDGGRNWHQVDFVYASKHLKLDISHIISFGKNVIFSSPTYYTKPSCIGFSNNYGRNWKFYQLRQDTYGLICNPVSPTQLVATTGHSNGFVDISSGELSLDMCPVGCGPVARCIAAPPNYMEKKKGAITSGHHGITGQYSFNSCDYDYVFWQQYGSDRCNSVAFLNNDTVFVVRDKGKIMRSNKGGIKDSWEMFQSPIHADLMQISFLNDSLGYIYGGNELLKTIDGGNTWQFEYTGISDPITGFQMISEHSGYIITSTGKIYRKNTTVLKAGDLKLKSPSSIQTCENQMVRFRLECENATHYQWYRNNQIVAGANQVDIEVKASESTAGSYVCVVRNAQNQLSSTPAVLSVFEIPEIKKQPQEISAYVGEPISLSLEARMQEKHQWYKEQSALEGENNQTLKFSSAQLSDAGKYHCRLSNQCGSIKSKEVVVKVNSRDDAKAYIQASPLSQSQCIGDTIELRVSALNAYSYQWKRNGEPIAQATTDIWSIVDLKTSDLGEYICEVKGLENTVSSEACTLSLHSKPILSFIGDTIFECDTGSGFSLVFAFEEAIAYQWYKDGIALGKTEQFLELSNLTVADGGLYQCLAIGYCQNSLFSHNIKISVLPKTEPSDSIPILSQSKDTLVCPMSPLRLFVNAPKGNSFQWYKNGTLLHGETSHTLDIVKVESIATFYCIIANATLRTRSLDMLVDIHPLLKITDHTPQNTSIQKGEKINLFVEAQNALAYQWLFKGAPLTKHPDVEKTHLLLENIQHEHAGKYTCRVFDACTHKDVDIFITVLGTGSLDSIVILSQSKDTLVCSMASVSLFVNAPKATIFQWYKKGLLINGTTSSILHIEKVDGKASYHCRMANATDTTSSLNMLVDIHSTLEIKEHSPEKLKAYKGDNLTLYVEALNTSKYQWHFKGAPLTNHPDIYKNILHLDSIQIKQAGRYLCRVFDLCGHTDIEIFVEVIDLDTTSIEQDVHNKKITYYPNPVQDVLFIKGELLITKIELYNNFGLLIDSYSVDKQKTFEIDVHSLSLGNYFLKIKFQDDAIKVVKFIKI